MKIRDIVKYARPEHGEEGFRFMVREINGDRCLCELMGTDTINPVETLRLSDVVKAATVIDGIAIEEDKLTNALFYNTTLDTNGGCSKADARKAARMMLAAPALFDALKRIADGHIQGAETEDTRAMRDVARRATAPCHFVDFTVPTCGIANTDPLDMTDENFEAWVNCLNRQGKEDWKQRRAEHKEGK